MRGHSLIVGARRSAHGRAVLQGARGARRSAHGGMPRGLPFRLSQLLYTMQARVRFAGGVHPHTAAATSALRAALDEEFPRRSVAKHLEVSAWQQRNKSRMKAWRLQRQVAELEAEVQRLMSSKTVGGRVSQEWLLRVCLAAPHASARAVAHSFRAVAGTDECTVSRPTISRIKDAWTDMYNEMVVKSARGVVSAHVASAEKLAALVLAHVMDETDIRLRSGDARDGPSVPRRGRASKVQAHVVTLVAGGQRREIPTELEALGDKTAPTLATSLEGQLRRVFGAVLPTSAPGSEAAAHGDEVWAAHILVGDGIPTNLAAAKLWWACVAERPLGPRVRYFLLVVKCATHQAALSAKSGVVGSFASAAGGELYKTIAGAAVRLFKYLVNDYYEEFCSAARAWTSTQLRVVAHGDGLRALYTSHVIRDEMLYLWNRGLGHLSHAVDSGGDPAEERPVLVSRFSQFVIGTLLKVDSHPTVTRFFTFRENIDRMLTMHLLGAPPPRLPPSGDAAEGGEQEAVEVGPGLLLPQRGAADVAQGEPGSTAIGRCRGADCAAHGHGARISAHGSGLGHGCSPRHCRIPPAALTCCYASGLSA